MKKDIQWHYEQATDEELLLSRRNVHVIGLDSFVLKNTAGLLTRVYAARTNALQSNYPYSAHPSIGIHDHLYNFTMEGVQGKVINYMYREAAYASNDMHTVDHYQFASIMKNIDTECTIPFRRVGTSNLKLQSAHLLEPGVLDSLQAHELHTVWAEPGAGWLIRERSYVTDRTYTNLFRQGTPMLGMEYYTQWNDVRSIRASFEEFFLA